MSLSRFNFPTPIQFGAGARLQVAAHLKALGFHKPLVVTDKGLAALPAFSGVMEALSAGGLQPVAFGGVWGNPTVSQVQAGVEAYRQAGADCLVGLGGGAALDVAKAIVLMVQHPGELFDYEDDKPGARPVDQPIPYWVALPTTAGTGSEVGRSAVISDDRTHIKKIIFDPRLLARAVFADPELTVGLPAGVTAATGMDALTHNIEAFLSRGFNPLCDGIALEGVHLASGSLSVCVSQPGDLEARGNMLMASLMGAVAFQKGLGLVHSCAHALSAAKDLHHGLANGVMIDHALAFNVPVVPERFGRLALAAGLDSREPAAFLAWLTGLKAAIGIPARLGALGVTAADVPVLADLAFQDACHPSNPRPCTRADFDAVFRSAL